MPMTKTVQQKMLIEVYSTVTWYNKQMSAGLCGNNEKTHT